MSGKGRFGWATLALTGLLTAAGGAGNLYAQAAPAAGGEAGGAEAAAPAVQGATFYQVVFGCGVANLVCWIMIFACSFAAVWFLIDCILAIRRDKLIPPQLVEGVREALSHGDLGAALEACEVNPSPLARILMGGFANVSEGYEVIQEAVGSCAGMETEKLMQRVNYLNLCGQIAPMLGLLGTVVGMVLAFATLASATGAAKSQLLAVAISTALYTTVFGLMIAVPCLLGYTLLKNYAVRLILESEATVLDLIKVLRNAEVEQEE